MSDGPIDAAGQRAVGERMAQGDQVPCRLPVGHPARAEVLARHARAVAAGLSTYHDPITGFAVLTARYLAERAFCCSSGCRHCPYPEAGRSR